ncbi:MAG: hypothetical protein ACFB20_01780 [Opitutales bacterium]
MNIGSPRIAAILTAIACTFTSLSALGQDELPDNYRAADVSFQQGGIERRLNEAKSFLAEANRAFGNQLYNYSFEVLAQSTARLDRADVQLDQQIEIIAGINDIFGDRRKRQELNEQREKLRQIYFEINRRATQLGRDIMPFVGINLDDVRWQLATLRYLCENANSAAVRNRSCKLLAELEQALENGNVAGVKAAINATNDLLEEGGVKTELEDAPTGERPGDPGMDASMAGGGAAGGGASGGSGGVAGTPGMTGGSGISGGGSGGSSGGPSSGGGASGGGSTGGGGVSGGSGGGAVGGGGAAGTFTPQPRPDDLAEESVAWTQNTLNTLCAEVTDPQLKAEICAEAEKLREAIARGDWAEARRIMDRLLTEFVPAVKQSQPELLDRLGGVPVVGENGEIQYFPADISEPGVGTRYIGGFGGKLVQEQQEFIETTTGGDRMFALKIGEERRWLFGVDVQRQAAGDGFQVDFRLDERRRVGSFTAEGWAVRGPGGQAIANGQGEAGTVTLEEPGNYLIEFSGRTEWGSPFKISEQVNVAL